jgi:hypothetical protein
MGRAVLFLRRSAKKELLSPKNILSRRRRRNVFAKIVKEPNKFSDSYKKKNRFIPSGRIGSLHTLVYYH